MPFNYSGLPSNVTQTAAPEITLPADGDGRSVDSVNTPFKRLADFVALIWTGFFTGSGAGAGVTATGGPTGAGVTGAGGSISGPGVAGTGTAGNSPGVTGHGQGSAAGVAGTGGVTGAGVSGAGGSTSGPGVSGAGSAVGSNGVSGTGGAVSGGSFTGTSAGAGVIGTGGSVSSGNGTIGVFGQGENLGDGVRGVGGTIGNGVTGVGGSGAGGTTGVLGVAGAADGSGVVAAAFQTSPTRGALQLLLQTPPSSPHPGDVWFDGTNFVGCKAAGVTVVTVVIA